MLQMRGRLPRPPELRGSDHRGAKGEPHDSDDTDDDDTDTDDDDDQVSVMLGKCGLSVGTCDKECAVLTVQGSHIIYWDKDDAKFYSPQSTRAAGARAS